MDSNGDWTDDTPQHLPLVDASVSWEIGDELINAVIAAAVRSEGQRPGTWQRMIDAVNQGAAKTEEGTANAFLFRAMVDRLLEEYRALNT